MVGNPEIDRPAKFYGLSFKPWVQRVAQTIANKVEA